MKNRFTKSYILVTSNFKKSKASTESVEKLFDLIYEMENIEKNLDETIMLCEIYNLIGLNIKTKRILDSLELSTKEEKIKSEAQTKLDRDNNYKNTRFYYRDLRESRIKKNLENLSVVDFVILNEGEVFKIEFAKITQLNIFNKFIKTTDISIYSDVVLSENQLDILIYFFHWLSDCKKELIDFYNANKIENKINYVGNEWFDGLDIWDVIIEIKDGKEICCQILASDYFNHNLGFELEISNDSIICLQYNPEL
ncbi:hypothetical protein [Chryseobacterium gregarium]|uniref:hypothetical protein n=1 Tax=Chryseobacterium gregarium TaxID=456299 RepID=UPI000414DC3A|nr:hypothetical protein [Chryseobacterium gregarium]